MASTTVVKFAAESKNMLVHGYITNIIQPLFNSTVIFPLSIYSLCDSYCGTDIINHLHSNYDHLLKIVVIGHKSGKSSLIQRYTKQYFTDTYIPTFGFDFSLITVRLKSTYFKLQLLDTGSPHERGIGPSPWPSYRGCYGVILVYDVTDRKSFDNIQKLWMQQMKYYGNDESVRILVGNKVDLEKKRVIDKNIAINIAETYNFLYYECSAKSGYGVDQIFNALVHKFDKKVKEQTCSADIQVSHESKKTKQCVCM
eukprot:160826_1